MEFRAIAVALVAIGCADHPPLEVAKVDLVRFQGGWFEIAKLPRPTQEGCTATTTTYRLKSPTELDVYSECRDGGPDGPVRRMAARAVVTDPAEPAKLSLDFGGFFGDYWIVDVDADYQEAAVGHPSRDYLWILSRTPTMNESDYSAVVETARRKDFDVNRLELTPQAAEGRTAPPSASSLPSPSDHGCSFAAPRNERATDLGAIALLGIVVFAIRRARTARPAFCHEVTGGSDYHRGCADLRCLSS